MPSHHPRSPLARSMTALALLFALIALPMLLIRPAAAAGPGGVTVYGGPNPFTAGFDIKIIPQNARSGVVEVATGGFHVLARKQDGSVIGWGSNAGGQLNIPTASTLQNVTQLSASTYYSLALNNGGVVAWGMWATEDGTAPSTTAVPVPTDAQSGVVQVAAGPRHVVARKSNGSVIQWGPEATVVVPAELSSGVTQVVAGAGFSAALKDGKVTVWGPGVSRPNIAADDPLNANLTQIGAGANFVVALTSTGTVVSWGSLVLPTPAPGGITQITAGAFHAVAVTSDGRLVGWGGDFNGELSQLPAGSIASNPATIQVAAGFGITVALAPLPALSSAAPPAGAYGTPYAGHSFTAAGATSYSVAFGSLPPGLSLAASGALTGTPTAAGTYGPFSIVASNGTGPLAAGDFTVVIAKAPLEVRAVDVTRKVGTPDPAVFAVAFDGWKFDDDSTVLTQQPTAAVSGDTSAVGEYDIVPSGGAAANYTFSYVNGTLTVTDKDVPTITWPTPAAIIYGTPLSAAQLNATASFEDAAVPGSFSYDPPLDTVLSAGQRTLQVTFTPTDEATYASVEESVVLSVERRDLTVTANDASRRVGASNPDFSVSYAGFAPGESATNLPTAPTASSAATPSDPVGAYDIVASGGVSPNYNFVYVNGTLTVTRAPLRVTAASFSVPVGQPLPALTFTVNPDDLVNDDTPASALSGEPATIATPASPVGPYAITIGTLSSTNYEIIFTEGTLTIENARVYLPLAVR
jgi:hypothetical protein